MMGRRKNAFSILYVVLTMSALLGFAALAVDYGGAQMSKTELRRAVDAAARAAAFRMMNPTEAIDLAKTSAAANTVNGTALTLADANIQFITWNPSSKTYTVLTGTSRANANAIRVNASQSIPLNFAKFGGVNSVTINAE